MAELTKNAKKFKKANDESPVTAGQINGFPPNVTGGTYVLQDGKRFTLTSEELRSLGDGYPKWGFDNVG